MRTLARLATGLAPALLLGACISFGPETPETLLTLESRVAPAAGSDRTDAMANALVVQPPSLARKLNTTRVSVQIDASNVAYLTGTAWVESPDRLVQRLLAETIGASTNRLVIDPDVAAGRQATTLMGELIEFGVQQRGREVVMIYDALLLGAEGDRVSKRRFEARVPVSAIEAGPVSGALNEAANRIAADVASWVGG